MSDRYDGIDQQTAIPQRGSTIYVELSALEESREVGGTYGSTMKTRDASVRFKATPPALSDTRKHSTSVFFMK